MYLFFFVFSFVSLYLHFVFVFVFLYSYLHLCVYFCIDADLCCLAERHCLVESYNDRAAKSAINGADRLTGNRPSPNN